MPIIAAVTNKNFAWTAISADPQFQSVLRSARDEKAAAVLSSLIKRRSVAWSIYVDSWNRVLATTSADPCPKPSKYDAWNKNLQAYDVPMRFDDHGKLSVLPTNPPPAN